MTFCHFIVTLVIREKRDTLCQEPVTLFSGLFWKKGDPGSAQIPKIKHYFTKNMIREKSRKSRKMATCFMCTHKYDILPFHSHPGNSRFWCAHLPDLPYWVFTDFYQKLIKFDAYFGRYFGVKKPSFFGNLEFRNGSKTGQVPTRGFAI